MKRSLSQLSTMKGSSVFITPGPRKRLTRIARHPVHHQPLHPTKLVLSANVTTRGHQERDPSIQAYQADIWGAFAVAGSSRGHCFASATIEGGFRGLTAPREFLFHLFQEGSIVFKRCGSTPIPSRRRLIRRRDVHKLLRSIAVRTVTPASCATRR